MLLLIDFGAEVPNTQRTRAIAQVRFDWSNHPRRDASDDFGVSTDAPKRIAFVSEAGPTSASKSGKNGFV